jgi:hypothetical protein
MFSMIIAGVLLSVAVASWAIAGFLRLGRPRDANLNRAHDYQF